MQQRQERIAAERRDEARVAREAMELRAQVQAEVDKQRQRHALVERREDMLKAYNEKNTQVSNVRGGGGTAGYFDRRLESQPTAHLSKLQQMREMRWARERQEQEAAARSGARGVENYR